MLRGAEDEKHPTYVFARLCSWCPWSSIIEPSGERAICANAAVVSRENRAKACAAVFGAVLDVDGIVSERESAEARREDVVWAAQRGNAGEKVSRRPDCESRMSAWVCQSTGHVARRPLYVNGHVTWWRRCGCPYLCLRLPAAQA